MPSRIRTLRLLPILIQRHSFTAVCSAHTDMVDMDISIIDMDVGMAENSLSFEKVTVADIEVT